MINPKFGCIKLGYASVGIFDLRYGRGIWQSSGEVCFDGSAIFGQGSKISVGPAGRLSVGDAFENTAKGEFICHNRMRLGMGPLVSWDTLFMDADFHQVDGNPVSSSIALGNNVWIGCKCTLLKGASVPDGAVFAAGSTVTK